MGDGRPLGWATWKLRVALMRAASVKEVGLELVKERKGDEEVEIANIIDKTLKKFKWNLGGNKLGNNGKSVGWVL